MTEGAAHSNQTLLPRQRLLRRIQRALQTSHVLLRAPAGYGKSILLRSLVAHQPASYYLPLTPADADLTVLRQRLAAVPSRAAVIVLDDVHHLVDGLEALAWMVERLRHTTPRWVLGGRFLPESLVSGQNMAPAMILESADLAFRLGESMALLRAFDESLAAQWHERAQGWPLALAMLANQSTTTIDVDVTTSTNEALFDYLAQAVCATLPAELMEFVKLSSLPLRFNDDLLAAILEFPLHEAAAARAEVQRRNLFLDTADASGWYEYHELVRRYFCGQVDEERRKAIAERLTSYFEATGDLQMAVEHALDGKLYSQAARLMSVYGGKMLLDSGWLHSYRRWLAAIPEDIHVQWPLIFAQYGFALVYQRGNVDEGLAILGRAQTLADELDELTAKEVELRLATAYHLIGEPEKALPLLLTALSYGGFPLRSQIRARQYLASVFARLNRLRDAHLIYRETASLLEGLEDEAERQFFLDVLRHNRGSGIEAVRGAFVQFEQTLKLSLQADAGKPAALEMDYVGYSILHENLGEWAALAEDLRQIKAARLQQSADPSADYVMTAKWEMFYWAAVHVGRQEFTAAQPLIDRFLAEVADAEAVACGQWLQAWSLRVQGRNAEVIAFVDSIEARVDESARFYRAAIAFERAAAALLANHADWDVDMEPHLRFHMQIGAKHYLLRWRVLFALAHYRLEPGGNLDEGVQRATWRKHVRFVHASLARYGYARLLIQREPHLATHFWALCAAEGIHPETAWAALKELGQLEPVFALLTSRSQERTDVQLRLITAVVEMGKEEAIPFLDEMTRCQSDKSIAAAIDLALDRLEALPPPQLDVKLLGDFALRRGSALVADAAWQRPGVRHLFLYFCLHHGERLPRTQILEDLWPDSDPQSALTAFRTNFSRLSAVLEPQLRRRTPMRYFEATGDQYVFDPQRKLATIDAERFLQAVLAASNQRPLLDEAQLAGLLETLATWEKPMNEVAYAAWAVHSIEALTERFAAGCQVAAEQLLALGRLADAATWAEKGVTVAPWNEACWQALIRCAARQGQRSLALKLYERTVAALAHELDAPPSEETVALVERLRRDEPI